MEPPRPFPAWREYLHRARSRLQGGLARYSSGPGRRRLFVLLPLLLSLAPRHLSQPSSGPGWSPPLPSLEILAVQARRVRVLLSQESRLRIDNSSWNRPVEILFDGPSVVLRTAGSGQELARGNGHRIEAAAARILRLDGRPFRGALEAFLNPDGEPVVVNELHLEDYLAGVVPLELGPVQFPYLEAQRAQSIAARSYALRHLGLRLAQGFDVFADVRSQVYGGQGAELELSSLAVLTTRGMAGVHEQEPILAYFSSTCGGMTAPVTEAFQDKPIPYLQGGVECPDQSSPYRNWTGQFPGSEFLRQLGVAGDSIEKLDLHRFPGGRLQELEIQTGRETRRIPGREVRTRLGLRSTWITSMIQQGGRILLEGHGYGHGVGLCQTGSVELARRGRRAEEILGFYYPGTVIEKIY